jgi:hypothetical protein
MEDSEIIGMTLEEAKTYLEPHGLRVRAKSIDGNPMMGTMDMQPNRINVSVDNGVITGVSRRG